MSELIRNGEVSLRLMRDDAADYELMATWLTDPRVLEFYEGRDRPFLFDRVVQEYSPRVLRDSGATACILLCDQRPIGYMQFCPVTSEEDRISYGLEPMDEGVGIFGTDQFIGEPEYWNRGIGTRAVKLLLSYLFDPIRAGAVVVDPHVENPRAIRCYEKSGFRKIKILPRHELHEGVLRDSWLMRAEP